MISATLGYDGSVGFLAADSLTSSGHTITGVVSGSMRVSTGIDTRDDTWNLGPRDGASSGLAANTDFAPAPDRL